MELKALAALAALMSCACAASAPRVPQLALEATEGPPVTLPGGLAGARYTVLEFFAAHCPCQAAHDARLRALHAAYATRRVRFYAVDSEAGASRERDAAEARARSYPFPVLLDPGGQLARSLGAEYATYSVVIDPAGAVVYRGGIDSDRLDLTRGARPYLKDALDDLLAGHAPRTAESKALGCALQTE